MGNKRKVLSFIVFAISIIVVWLLFKDNLDIINKIKFIDVWDFIFVSFFVVGTFVLNGIKNIVLVKPFGINLEKKEWFGLSIVNTFWNYLPFQGGLIAKGAYLKKKHNFPYTDYLSVIGVSYLITFMTLGMVGVIFLLLNFFIYGNFSWLVFAIYSLITISFSIIFIYFKVSKKELFEWKYAKRIQNGIKLITNQKKILYSFILLDLSLVIVYALRIIFSGQALELNIPIMFYLLVAPISSLSIFTSITPGGLVIRETLIGIFASWMLINTAEAVTASILDRGISMVWILILGLFFNYYLSRKITK